MTGWLHKFKKRHSIKFWKILVLAGQVATCDTEAGGLQVSLESLSPRKSLAAANNTVFKGIKVAKDRITSAVYCVTLIVTCCDKKRLSLLF